MGDLLRGAFADIDKLALRYLAFCFFDENEPCLSYVQNKFLLVSYPDDGVES